MVLENIVLTVLSVLGLSGLYYKYSTQNEVQNGGQSIADSFIYMLGHINTPSSVSYTSSPPVFHGGNVINEMYIDSDSDVDY